MKEIFVLLFYFLLLETNFCQDHLLLKLQTFDDVDKGAVIAFNDYGLDSLMLSSGKKIAAHKFSIGSGMLLSDDFKEKVNYKDNVEIYLISAGDGKVFFIKDKNRDRIISEDEMVTFFLNLFNQETIELYHNNDASKDLKVTLNFKIRKFENNFELAATSYEAYMAFYVTDLRIDTIIFCKNIFSRCYYVNNKVIMNGDSFVLSDGAYRLEDIDYVKGQLILNKDTSSNRLGVSKSYFLDRDSLQSAFTYHDLSYLDDRSQEYLIFHFWGTWCTPCMQKLEESDRMLQALPKDKFVVVNIAFLSRTETDREIVSEVLEDHYKGLINVIEKSTERPIMKVCHSKRFPSYIIVDRENKVIYNSQNEKLEVAEMLQKL